MISGISQYSNFPSGVNAMSGRPRPEEMFAKLDANGDDYVDKAEFSSFHKQMSGTADNAGRLEEMFAKIDSDGDGKISKSEDTAFIASMKERMAPPPSIGSGQSQLSEVFSAMDANGDGSVNKSEMDSYLLKLTNEAESVSNSNELFAKIDSDGDGNISQSENDNFIKQLFANLTNELEGASLEKCDNGTTSRLNLATELYSQTTSGSTKSVVDLKG